MSELSGKQIQTYIDDQGACCPRCKDPDLEGGPAEVFEGVVFQPVVCTSCDLTWTDAYTLSFITDVKTVPLDNPV